MIICSHCVTRNFRTCSVSTKCEYVGAKTCFKLIDESRGKYVLTYVYVAAGVSLHVSRKSQCLGKRQLTIYIINMLASKHICSITYLTRTCMKVNINNLKK